MNSELKYLLKGKWNFNIRGNSLICKNKTGLVYIFENKDDLFFQNILSVLSTRGNADPTLWGEYAEPEAPIPLDVFHKVLRANEILFEQSITLNQSPEGLFSNSEHIKDLRINYHEYADEFEVRIDPQRMCKITRRIRDRARVQAKLLLEKEDIILQCTFPWTVMTVVMPTLQN